MSDEKSGKLSWKDKLTFLEPDGVEYEVDGKNIMFYPVSTGTLFEIKIIGKPLAKALAVLFDDKGRDFGSVNRNFHTADGKHLDSEVIIEPVSVEVASLRIKQRENSVESLIDALLDDKAKKVVGKLIVESMRDEWDGVDPPPPIEFMNQVPGTALVPLLTGVAIANKGVLGPLAGTLANLWAKAQTRINQALSDDETNDETSNPIGDTKTESEAKMMDLPV